ncbi:hypothetical protein RHMOL_Rhmol09G0060700 [Rhododendron molle]|uniref:Uncharacterized protein n=1 Tax=Rhododendron molle TaxID=49168 RepID=A0ACC0MAC1_RHOML|nr:hypothetical protein RHMOL_Rhmol09G0060700 [Rhododendron molle]
MWALWQASLFYPTEDWRDRDEIDWWFGCLYAHVSPALCQWTSCYGSHIECPETLLRSSEQLSYGGSYICLDPCTCILIMFMGSMYFNQLSEKQVELEYSMLLYCLALCICC